MKKIITAVISFLILTLGVTPVFALGDNLKINTVMMRNSSTSAGQTGINNKVGTLKERALREISKRIDSLNKLLSRINSMNKLSEAQKSALTSQIQTQISSLTTLQAKINADTATDLQTLKTDVQSIVKSYRIYALFVPKDHVIAAADRINAIADQFSSFSAKVEGRNSEAQAKGLDTTSVQPLLADMKAKIADAKLQSKSATDTVTSLTPDGYPANKPTLLSAITMLQKARQDLVSAKQDLTKIIQILRSVNKSITPTLSTSLKNTPTSPAGCHYASFCPKTACRQGQPCPTCTPKLVCMTPATTGAITPAGGGSTIPGGSSSQDISNTPITSSVGQ